MVKAKDMIAAASEAGADCVKFQWVYADEILHPNTGMVNLPGGPTRLYDTFKALERPPEFYAELKAEVEARGLLFLCTPFGPRSAAELAALKPKMMKIASPELNYVQLLEQVAGYGLPTLLSTGVSRLADIERAIGIFNREMGVGAGLKPAPTVGTRLTVSLQHITVLHCITSYPAPPEEYNLRLIPNLSALFGVPVGLSDHSLDPVLLPALATALGAAAIEKHFCLCRDDPGLDDPIALPPDDFRKMVDAITMVDTAASYDAAVGAGFKPAPAINTRAIDTLKNDYGSALVDAALGDGVKRLAPAEEANYGRTNRSIHAMQEIKAGETIRAEMLRILRTEKVLRPGLSPEWLPCIIGRKAGKTIPAGEGIRFEDI
jgi:sialic acid synthase SpsE